MWLPSQAAALRAAKRKSNYYARLDATALAGVLLALLIMFMVYQTPRDLRGSVDLPHALYCSAQPGAMREDAIRIAISRDGRIYLNRSAVPLEKLPKLIREEVSAGSERKVYISVDSRASNSDAESVLDQIRSAGITRVAFLTDRTGK